MSAVEAADERLCRNVMKGYTTLGVGLWGFCIFFWKQPEQAEIRKQHRNEGDYG